ncbi:hypothetical protein WH87_04890 [Devosia epidermidihirudinis]|uniref:Uncharacterized protein n=1 Tax=Devosia epidermidihirudinis TaxID=1293439 RepID=A0A0F5QFN1_9HYPH|nr:hypothetical protein WH87_04890 [Devosia epidermidihirudinis]
MSPICNEYGVYQACAACEAGRRSAKAAGHRDWALGVCFDHAGISWERWLSKQPMEMQLAIGGLVPDQLDLFGAAA